MSPKAAPKEVPEDAGDADEPLDGDGIPDSWKEGRRLRADQWFEEERDILAREFRCSRELRRMAEEEALALQVKEEKERVRVESEKQLELSIRNGVNARKDALRKKAKKRGDDLLMFTKVRPIAISYHSREQNAALRLFVKQLFAAMNGGEMKGKVWFDADQGALTDEASRLEALDRADTVLLVATTSFMESQEFRDQADLLRSRTYGGHPGPCNLTVLPILHEPSVTIPQHCRHPDAHERFIFAPEASYPVPHVQDGRPLNIQEEVLHVLDALREPLRLRGHHLPDRSQLLAAFQDNCVESWHMAWHDVYVWLESHGRRFTKWAKRGLAVGVDGFSLTAMIEKDMQDILGVTPIHTCTMLCEELARWKQSGPLAKLGGTAAGSCGPRGGRTASGASSSSMRSSNPGSGAEGPRLQGSDAKNPDYALALTPSELRDLVKEMFSAIDRDGNGDLDQEELSQVLLGANLGLDRESVECMLVDFDQDGNGVINIEEMIPFVVDMVMGLQARRDASAMGAADDAAVLQPGGEAAALNRKLTLELPSREVLEDALLASMQTFDIWHDGHLSLKDIRNALTEASVKLPPEYISLVLEDVQRAHMNEERMNYREVVGSLYTMLQQLENERLEFKTNPITIHGEGLEPLLFDAFNQIPRMWKKGPRIPLWAVQDVLLQLARGKYLDLTSIQVHTLTAQADVDADGMVDLRGTAQLTAAMISSILFRKRHQEAVRHTPPAVSVPVA